MHSSIRVLTDRGGQSFCDVRYSNNLRIVSPIAFYNCSFESKVTVDDDCECYFVDCNFKKDSVFYGQCSFLKCTFLKSSSFAKGSILIGCDLSLFTSSFGDVQLINCNGSGKIIYNAIINIFTKIVAKLIKSGNTSN